MAGSPLSAARETRFRWYRLVEQEGWSVKEVCRVFGISRQTYYKWNRLDHGRSPRVRHARLPHPQTKIFGRVRVLLVEAKRKYNYGPRKMRAYLFKEMGVSVSASAIYKFMRKKGLIRKPQKKQAWYVPLKHPFHANEPGENVQLDVKYVPGVDGCWKYQFRFLDTVTNMQYATESFVKDARSTIKALYAAQRVLPFEIRGIQTDNGGEFRGVFHEHLLKTGIHHRFIPKRSAPWNGKVERANRSVDDEYYLNVWRPWKRLHHYTRWYNYERPHLGKGMDGLTPYQKYLTFVTPKCQP